MCNGTFVEMFYVLAEILEGRIIRILIGTLDTCLLDMRILQKLQPSS